MNHHIKLLDCTLRDGGYVNDWRFGKENIINIFERLVSSGVDVIEVGFLDERCAFDPERTIMPDTESVEKIFGALDRGKSKVVGMIDYGTCGIENLQPCAESYLDGIRVIFKKELMREAIAFCKQIKALGYLVFSQAVSITSYTDDELVELVSLVNDCHPTGMSMVDTYGLCDAGTLRRLIDVIDAHLDRDIMLCYHAHNNFQLGYSNSCAVLASDVDRDILVDGSLYGMGKSAGNAPVELVAMHMNLCYGRNFHISQMMEAISTSILDIYQKKPWGYTLFYYIAASNKCHPDYVSYLMNKRTLSVTAVNEILQSIPDEKKLGKDMQLIEQLYLQYQDKFCNDAESLAQLQTLLSGKHILVLGPGGSVSAQSDRIRQYQTEHECVTLAINYIPESIAIDYMFLTNSRRYLQFSNKLAREYRSLPIIATSNVTRTEGRFTFEINYSALIDKTAEFPDNSMLMLMRLLMQLDVREVALAGLDGYTPDSVNYFDQNMEYSFVKEKADSLNQSARAFYRDNAERLHVEFITASHYQE